MNPYLLLLVRSWPVLAAFSLGAVATAYIGANIYDARVLKLKQQRTVAVQEVRDEAKRDKDTLLLQIRNQQIQTEELNRESNEKMADLQRRVADARRLYQGPAACIPITVQTSPTPGGGNTESVQKRYVQQGDGIDAQHLISYFNLSEEIRDSQDICRRQMDEIYRQ